jgi:DNA-binding CsgD family transcriptional regulator
VVLGHELIAHGALTRTAFYADFGRRYDIVRCAAGLIEAGPSGVSVISVDRSEARGAFGSEQKELLTALMPHLQRALQLHRRLSSTEAASNDFVAALDRMPHAVFFVSGTGRITFANGAARQLTAARDGLIADGDELRACGMRDTTRLRELCSTAVAASAGRGLGSGGTLLVGRPSGKRPLVALVSPLTPRDEILPSGREPVAMVVVSDPDRAEIPDEHVIRELLDLTSAEARLTRLLANGLTLTEAARQLGLTTATIRTRVKTIFQKTGTHRQSDLIRLVLTGSRSL